MTHPSVEALTKKEVIITNTITQIQRDLYDGEIAPLFELLERVPLDLLRGYISEAMTYEQLRYN